MRSLIIAGLFVASSVSSAYSQEEVSLTAFCSTSGDPLAEEPASVPQCVVVGGSEAKDDTLYPAATLMFVNSSLVASNSSEAGGWDTLSVVMNVTRGSANPLPIATRYYGMGFAEGYATFPSIYNYYSAMLSTSLGDRGDTTLVEEGFLSLADMLSKAPAMSDFIANVMSRVVNYANSSSPTATSASTASPLLGRRSSSSLNSLPLRLKNLLSQLNGLADGYKKGCADAMVAGTAATAAVGSCTEAMLAAVGRREVLLINMRGELLDIYNSLTTAPKKESTSNEASGSNSVSFDNYLNTRTSTGLIVATPSDIIVSHVTNDAYRVGLFKQFKQYSYEISSSDDDIGDGDASDGDGRPQSSPFVAMSSYPGALSSLDDWYQSGTGLAVIGTQIVNNNNALTARYLFANATSPAPPVPSFLRAMVATLFAQTGPQWAAMYNDATSNGRPATWSIVDMKRFVPSVAGTDAEATTIPMPTIAKDTLTIVETIPGSIKTMDASGMLTTLVTSTSAGTSKASLTPNTTLGAVTFTAFPYFPEHYAAVGANALAAAYGGEYFSQSGNPVAKMLVRDVTVTNAEAGSTVDSIAASMRSNMFDTDVFSVIQNCSSAANASVSVCSPPFSSLLAIGARGDVNPIDVSSPLKFNYGPLAPLLDFRLFGAVDVKISTFRGMTAHNVAVAASSGDKTNVTFLAFIAAGPTSSSSTPFPATSVCPAAAADFTWEVSVDGSGAKTTVPHVGLANIFNFTLVAVASHPRFEPSDKKKADDAEEENDSTHMIGVGLGGGALVLALIIVIAYRSHKKKQREDHEHMLNCLAAAAAGGAGGKAAESPTSSIAVVDSDKGRLVAAGGKQKRAAPSGARRTVIEDGYAAEENASSATERDGLLGGGKRKSGF